jgi:tetratricopeptide (TPR) repeat protein
MALKIKHRHKSKSAGPASSPLVQAKLNEAIALHQQGRFEQAIALYSDILRIEPRHFDAIHLLGVIADQMKNHQLAADLIDQAIAINSSNADAYFNRGNALKELNRLDAAVESYDKAIRLNPRYANAFNNRGVVLQKLNQFDAAVESYSQAVRIKPDYAEAQFNLGVVLQELRRFDEALASYGRVIVLVPDHATAHYNCGVALYELARFDEALASYDRAIAVDPGYVEAYSNRGVTLQKLARLDDALASFDRAIALNPDYVEAYSNRGNVLKDLNRLDESLASYDLALERMPNDPEAHSNRGVVLQGLRRFDEAFASYDRALTLDPAYPKAHWNKGLALLLNGDFQNGWPLYEWRWNEDNATSKSLITSKPQWAGAENKRVLVWAEQGVGDELMFASMLPEFQKLCSKLIVKVDFRLIPLLARSMPKEMMFFPSNHALAEAEYDEHIPMGSLCGYFRAHESSFGGVRDGYIVADKERTVSIRETLKKSDSPNKRICGISWKSKNEKSGAARSLALRTFVEILSSCDVDFVSLQYGDTDEEIRQVRSELGVDVRAYKNVDNLNDLDGLASLIQACDVVVSVDNSTVHLAGALGQDTRVLLPYVSNWRWLMDRDDSPWYSSVKLYRQGRDLNWSGVFENVKADLLRLRP